VVGGKSGLEIGFLQARYGAGANSILIKKGSMLLLAYSLIDFFEVTVVVFVRTKSHQF